MVLAIPKLLKRLLNWRSNNVLERALDSERERAANESWPNAKASDPIHPDAVFFGVETTARIVSINGEKLCYQDSEGCPFEVSLKACSRGADVGFRYLDEPPWTVTLFDPASTRMEFESYEMAYKVLLGPLGQNGWRTLDCT